MTNKRAIIGETLVNLRFVSRSILCKLWQKRVWSRLSRPNYNYKTCLYFTLVNLTVLLFSFALMATHSGSRIFGNNLLKLKAVATFLRDSYRKAYSRLLAVEWFPIHRNENPEMATNGSGVPLCVKPLDDLVFIIHGLSPKAELFIGDLEKIN